MEGQASISADILARYAADAAREVDGVRGARRAARGVKVPRRDGGVRVELHLAVDWGASIPEVGRDVQARVREYLRAWPTSIRPSVDVVVDEIGPRA